MQKEYPQKLLFVINPVSGGKNKADWESTIRNYFKPLPCITEFYLLTGENDKESVKHYIETIQPDKVVAVGGDGTIKLVAELVKNTPTIVGILPAGSANGMAKELNIPAEAEKALDVILNGVSKPIDLININDKEICMHLSDIGLNAMLVKNFEQSKGRGMWGYIKPFFKVILGKRLMYVTLKTDKEEVKRKAYMVAIANAAQYGTGATINPGGDVADGYFEAVVIRKLKLFELLKMLLKNQAFDEACIEVFKTTTLELSTIRKAYFQVDGEYRNKVKTVKAAILPHALQVMVPVP
jgi:YegS/Rv2252/BmrU family lipid kinase